MFAAFVIIILFLF